MLKLLKNHYLQTFLFLSLLILVKFYPLFLGKTLFFGDNYSLMIPGKIFTASWLKQGILPLWNPTIFAGLSWIGDINQSIFYPSTLLFIFLKLVWAFNINLISHLLIAGLGMYGLARAVVEKMAPKSSLIARHFSSLLAMTIWLFSWQIMGSLNNISFIQTLAWMPAVVWAGQSFLKNNRSRFLLAFLITLQMAAGYPQFVLYSVGLSFVLSSYFRFAEISLKNYQKIFNWLVVWLSVGILSIFLSAFIWLPFLVVFLDSTRVIQSEAQASSGSLQIADFIKTFVPHFFENSVLGMKWGRAWNSLTATGIYFGWLPLSLIIFSAKSKKTRQIFFGGLFSFFTLLSLGENLPGFNFLLKILPILKVTRTPSNFLIVSVFVMALLVGIVFAKLKPSADDFKNLKKLGFVTFILGLISFISYLFITANFSYFWNLADQILQNKLSTSLFHTLVKDQLIFISIFKNITVNLFLLSLALFFWGRKKLLLVVFIVALDLIYANANGLFFAPNSVYDYKNTPLNSTEFSQISDPQYRALTRNYNYPYTDFNFYYDSLILRRPFSDSYIDARELQEFNHLQRMRAGLTPNWNMTANLNIINGFTTLLPQDMSNLWNGQDRVGINNLDEIKINEERHGELLSEWAVKYYLVDTWFPSYEDEISQPLLVEKDFWQVYDLESLARFRYENNSPVNLEDFTENPNQITLTISNQENREYLIIADHYEKNWQVEINGHSETIENHNGMRKVKLAPGINKLIFKYFPIPFYLGAGLSFGTMLVMILFIFSKDKLGSKF
jgi:hypothetical protein